MSNLFTSVEMTKPNRSLFDMSHEVRMSTRMGRLTPIMCMEVIPNDTIKINNEVMLRLAPMLAPIFHRVNLIVESYFIPNRILATWWEAFITNGRLGTELPPVPSNATYQSIGALGLSRLDLGSLYDYLGGNPINDATANLFGARTIDLLPFAAYQKVWMDHYRDRNFIADPTWLPLAPGTIGANLTELTALRNRDWQPDYFTTSLPWTQRGATVLIPMQGSATNINYLSQSLLRTTGGSNATASTFVGSTNASNSGLFINKINAGDAGVAGRIENIQSIDFSNSQITINDFRRAQRLQMFFERQALAGSRYNETIYAHFARRTSDARLQRAEFIGGSKTPIKIQEVVAPNWSNDGTQNIPAGDMSGHGISYSNRNGIKYNCEEHGFVITLLSVMPTTAYMQGTPPMFRRRNTFLDYPWPTFAHIGEQPVYNHEIWTDSSSIALNRTQDPIFGYQSRYSDWKFQPSRASGAFRTTLNFWHLTRLFSSQPILSATFNTFDSAAQDRIFAVQNGSDTVWTYIYNNVKVKRSLPYYGTPML